MKRSSRKKNRSIVTSEMAGHYWSLVLRKGGGPLKLLLLGAITFLLSTGIAYGSISSVSHVSRHISSLGFPVVDSERSTDDILDAYPAYLKFAVEVGKDVDRDSANKLVKIFDSLKRKNPKGAALFLKGLRFEMIQKIELMGRDPRDVSSSNPEYRRWIGKYLKEWVREADEHLFRALSASKAELAFGE